MNSYRSRKPTMCRARDANTPERLLFHVSTTFPEELDTSDTVPEDLHFWFLQNESRVPTTAPISVKEPGTAWTSHRR